MLLTFFLIVSCVSRLPIHCVFMNQGADPNCVNKNEYTPLHVAVKNKHTDAIEVLVHNGAEINSKGPSSM